MEVKAMTENRAECELVAQVAIDWGDQKHHWKLGAIGGTQTETGQLSSKPEQIDAWANGLRERFPKGMIAVCVEQSRGGLIYTLSKHAHLILYPVHPQTSANYRVALYPSGAKNDPRDTDVLYDLLEHHRDRLRPLRPDTASLRLIQLLSEQRRKMVAEKTRCSQRLRACLQGYFPQIGEWFEDVSTPLVGALLGQWGTLPELQRCHAGTLRRFFRAHNCRSSERIQQRIEAIAAAKPLTEDMAVVEHGVTTARDQVAMLATLRSRIAGLDRRLAELFAAESDSAIFASFPGAGAVLAARLLAAWGSNRDRYGQSDEMQTYSGIAPVGVDSGKRKSVHFRRACPKFLRQTFHEFANCSRAQSQWAQAFYEMQRGRGKDHHAAVRSLAFKWIRIAFRCWQSRTPYDEQTYLRSLAQRGSPLRGALGTAVEWKTVGGFKKLCKI
jgi:transposase